MPTPRILIFAGSTRTGSYNKQLARAATETVRAAGAEASYVDLRDYPMPVYDGDLETEQGMPEHARSLRELFKSHHGFVIASPENNASVSSALKNTLDWISRELDGESGLVPYSGKTALLLAASPGDLGGLRGLVHLRNILNALQVFVLPGQLAVSAAHKAFGPDGKLADARQQATLESLCKQMVETTAKLIA